jgi:hypothetical protein
VGNDPALNIVLAIKTKRDDPEWQKPTRIPPIGREGEFDIFWLGDTNPAVIAASYEDFLAADTPDKSREYTVLIQDDINRIFPERLLPSWDITQSCPHWQRQPGAKNQHSFLVFNSLVGATDMLVRLTASFNMRLQSHPELVVANQNSKDKLNRRSSTAVA